MPDSIMPAARVAQQTEHFDVLIVGAGISGVGAAYHLTKQCPGTSFVALEAQDTFGGTWITHRYPGIRSDSDLYTFGYRFKPWTGAPIASAAEILRYMGEVIDDNGLAPHIRYRHTLSSASWSSRDNRWTLEGARTDTGEPVRFTAKFLWMCQGYYRHSEGYTPEWPGMPEFKGRIVHPQNWPEDLDYAGKNVVVIGSGATAATLIPDGALLQAIRSGKASVVTDEIERITAAGILLKSGNLLDADIIVTATGFHLNVLGDIEFAIDGKPLVFADTVTYRGMMFTGIPNMAWVFGYFRASWTLRADLVADFVCRLLNHMKAIGARKVTPVLRPEDKDMPILPWIDPENFNPGYLMRGMHLLPKRGDKPEWQHTQDYWTEKDEFAAIDLDDRAFYYE